MGFEPATFESNSLIRAYRDWDIKLTEKIINHNKLINKTKKSWKQNIQRSEIQTYVHKTQTKTESIHLNYILAYNSFGTTFLLPTSN